jgi:heme/copper-type cytochrome/quinol oxidase subunit 3
MNRKEWKIFIVVLPFIMVALAHAFIYIIFSYLGAQGAAGSAQNNELASSLSALVYFVFIGVHGPLITFGVFIGTILLEIAVMLADLPNLTEKDKDCWYCEYCGKEYQTKKDCDRHEETCPKRNTKK